MAMKIRLEQLTKIGSQAIEKALSGHELPQRGVAIVTGFEGDSATVEYILTGKRPEDGVVLARACLNRTTGEVTSVKVLM